MGSNGVENHAVSFKWENEMICNAFTIMSINLNFLLYFISTQILFK